jgi:hypothetical protein
LCRLLATGGFCRPLYGWCFCHVAVHNKRDSSGVQALFVQCNISQKIKLL